MPYTVAVDAYHGPLDLLLYLVRKHEVDILDVPLAAVADQFVEYLTTLTELDLEFAGEFLVLAATLMEVKSRALLPAGAEPAAAEPDAPDPRRELVKQLLEYRQFKDAAAALEDRANRHAARVPRQELPDDESADAAGPAVRPVEVWDLVSAFARLVRETQAAVPAAVVADDTPQHVYEAELTGRVRAAGRLPFRAAFTPPYHKPRLIGLFLALLELVRHHGLGLEQTEADGEIWLTAGADDSARVVE